MRTVTEHTKIVWKICFFFCDKSLEDALRSGKLFIVNNEELCAIVENNFRLMCQELSQV